MPYKTVIIDGKKVTLDENGKPCKACNTLESFQGLMKGAPAVSAGAAATATAGREEPPDKAQLGRNTWTFLHSMAAYYPQNPSDFQKKDMANFINSFANFYPCVPCAADFKRYVAGHPPNVDNREQLSHWFCDAHNAVNKKLHKPEFDCNTWRKRWRDGWAE